VTANLGSELNLYKVASSLEEAKGLVETGFDYVADADNHKLFGTRKQVLVPWGVV
jgi:hypothetical protein